MILIPALAWTRLETRPAALAAVVAHELGHAVHRDLRRLRLLERAIEATVWVAILVVLTRLGTSLWVDLRAPMGTLTEAVLANVLGKSSDLAVLAVAAVGAGMVRASAVFREHMADRYAIQLVGASAFDKAEATLGGTNHVRQLRSWRRWDAAQAARQP